MPMRRINVYSKKSMESTARGRAAHSSFQMPETMYRNLKLLSIIENELMADILFTKKLGRDIERR